MAINPTTVLRHVKRKMGASLRVVPLSDDEILDIILEETLYTFSKYYPYMTNITIDKDREKLLDMNGYPSGKYYLNTGGLEVLGIAKMFRGEGYINGGLYPQLNTDNIFDMQMNADVASAIKIPDTCLFIPPNIVEIFPKYIAAHDMLFTVKCVHPKHLATIPLSLRDDFFQLAELDVKISIYNILKLYDQIDTAFGSFNLKLEDFESAEDKREQLLEKFDSNFYKEPNRKKIWIC